MPKEKIFAQARDELFSHINRCGVLSATDDDRITWMTETIDYIGERYPDLVDPDLQELHAVGIRFCQPAINNVPSTVAAEPVAEPVAEGEDTPKAEVEAEDTPKAEVEAENATEAEDAPEAEVETEDATEAEVTPEATDAPPAAAAQPVSQTS